MIRHAEDRLKLWLPALAMGVLTAGFILAKTGRDALFFQGKGIFQLPEATLAIAAASLPLAILFVKAMKVWGARPARMGVMLFAVVVIASIAPFLQPGASPLMFAMFIFVPSVFGILFASLWLLATDIFETTPKAEAARAFGKIGAGSLAGGMAGGFAAKGMAELVAAKWLLFSGALLVVLVMGLVWLMHRRFPTHIQPGKKAEKSGRAYFATLSHPYARILMLIAMTGAFAGLLIDAQFYIAASMANMGEAGNAHFFANFYIMLNLGSLLLQLFLAPKVQDKIGLRGGLMVLPFALVGGASFVAAAATAFSRSLLKVTESGLRASIHRSLWEQAFIPIQASERSDVKLVADGVAARIAEGLGAALILVWVMDVAPGGVPRGPIDTTWMAWLTLVTVAVWLAVTYRLRPRTAEPVQEQDCVRFPDQCPCTTELGKDVP